MCFNVLIDFIKQIFFTRPLIYNEKKAEKILCLDRKRTGQKIERIINEIHRSMLSLSDENRNRMQAHMMRLTQLSFELQWNIQEHSLIQTDRDTTLDG